MKYFLDRGENMLWYLVPENKRIEWNEWRESGDDKWPEFVFVIDEPSSIIFENPTDITGKQIIK